MNHDWFVGKGKRKKNRKKDDSDPQTSLPVTSGSRADKGRFTEFSHWCLCSLSDTYMLHTFHLDFPSPSSFSVLKHWTNANCTFPFRLTMKLSQTLVRIPFTTTSPLSAASPQSQNPILSSNGKRVSVLWYKSLRFPNCACSSTGASVSSPSTPLVDSNSGFDPVVTQKVPGKLEGVEEGIEKVRLKREFLLESSRVWDFGYSLIQVHG